LSEIEQVLYLRVTMLHGRLHYHTESCSAAFIHMHFVKYFKPCI